MTEERFFRFASFAPLIIPGIAGLATVALKPIESLPSVFTIRSYAADIAFYGLYSTIPYLLFLIILYALIRPSTVEVWHQTLATAPLFIAAAFAAAVEIYAITRGAGLSAFVTGVPFFGMLALMVAYAYAGAIWLTSLLFKRLGWIRASAAP